MPNKIKKIEARTIAFIKEYKRLETAGLLPERQNLMEIMKVKSKSTISGILKKRQNIQPEQWVLFRKHFGIDDIANSSDFSVPRENISERQEPKENLNELLVQLMKQQNKLMETQNRILKGNEETYSTNIKLLENSIKEINSSQLVLLNTQIIGNAYQKFWISHWAEQQAQGDPMKKEDLEARMNIAVADKIEDEKRAYNLPVDGN